MNAIRNWWTPRRVVTTLAWYQEIAGTLEAGTFSPGESHPGASEWEPGGTIEKLVLRKADIDHALKRIDRRCASAVRAYFIDGHDTFYEVARILRVSESQARRLTGHGVGYIAMLLCDRISAGMEAIQIVKEVRQKKTAAILAEKTKISTQGAIYELE